MADTPKDFSKLLEDFTNASRISPFQPEKYFSPDAVRLTNLAMAESRRSTTPVDYSYMEMTLKALDSFENDDRESAQNAVNQHADLVIALGYSKGINRFPSDIITTAINTGNIKFNQSTDFAPITAAFKKAEFEIADINRSVEDAIESAKERATETVATEEIVAASQAIPLELAETTPTEPANDGDMINGVSREKINDFVKQLNDQAARREEAQIQSEEISLDRVEAEIEKAIAERAAQDAALEQNRAYEPETVLPPAASEEVVNGKAVEDLADTKAPSVQLLKIEKEITYRELAEMHGVTVEDLNTLNEIDLADGTLLAKNSELYVPTNPNPAPAPEVKPVLQPPAPEEMTDAEVAEEELDSAPAPAAKPATERDVFTQAKAEETPLKFPIHFEHVTDPNRVPEEPQSKPELTERQKEFVDFLDENGKVKTEMPNLTREQLASIQNYINEGDAPRRAIIVDEQALEMEAEEGVLPAESTAVQEEEQPAKNNIQSTEFASELSKLLDGISSNDMGVIKFLQNKGIEFDLPQERSVIVTSAASAELGQAYLKLHGKDLNEEEFMTLAGKILEKGVVVNRPNEINDVAPDASLNPTQIHSDLAALAKNESAAR